MNSQFQTIQIVSYALQMYPVEERYYYHILRTDGNGLHMTVFDAGGVVFDVDWNYTKDIFSAIAVGSKPRFIDPQTLIDWMEAQLRKEQVA